jgi:hypothetical protein
MKPKNKRRDKKKLLPFPIIEAASKGDIESMFIVLKHYEGYIMKLSTKYGYDEYGQMYPFVDETLRKRLEIKLIKSTLAFEPVPYRKKPKVSQ